MEEIKRIGPPTAINVRGSEYDLSVPLNATPSRAWRQTFQAPHDWKEPFHPSRITMTYRALHFTSEDCRVHLWVALIDKWIASANELYAQATGSPARLEATEPEKMSDQGLALHEGTLETRNVG